LRSGRHGLLDSAAERFAVRCLVRGLGARGGLWRRQRTPPAGTHDPAHAEEVARDPSALTCGDLARQPLHPESQKLAIRAEFALAREPGLRKIRAKETLNRTGRSVYYAMTEICKGRRPSFEPARPAVEAVRRGKYLAARHRPG
jgi:hypothetical protein